MSTEPILGFFDEYRFLSNFEGPGFWAFGIWWPTNEHFYQAMKTTDTERWIFISQQTSPGKAKRAGRQVEIREGWDQYLKEPFMRIGLWKKFEDAEARQRLLDTGDRYLEETNTWNDTYWGTCEGVGLNRLGSMLMDLRYVLRDKTATLGAMCL